MDVLKHATLSLAFILTLSGCQFTYLIKNGYHQAKILGRRVPISEVLTSASLPPELKKKIELVQEVRAFIRDELKLKVGDNYTSFVQLDGPFVTYALSGAKPFHLEPYEWRYPLVGTLPYRGHFLKEEALEDELQLKAQGFDTYVRGVAAYSTLGWFNDPILSSMLRYRDENLVNLIIHETVHANLFVKGKADFNERLATFIGNLGTEMFYLKKEGPSSPHLKEIRDSSSDDKLFSEFLSSELGQLKSWYVAKEGSVTPDLKEIRIKEIQTRFISKVWPLMKSSEYVFFKTESLNNARLLSLKTYFYDLSDFEKVYDKLERNFLKFFEMCRSLQSSENPEEALKLKASS